MKKVILVTGVSSGFGLQIAKALSSQGHIVYGSVRKDGYLLDGVNVVKMDVTSEQQIKSTIDGILSKEGRLDVLINNAGMHTGGAAETTSADTIRLQMETNFNGLVHLTREVLPHMRKLGGGRIINFSSIGGLMGLPFQAFYSASKFAVEGFSEALRMEVRKFNIEVIVINPGDFSTSNSANRRNYLAPHSEGDAYDGQFKRTLAAIEKDETGGLDPAILAKKIARIVTKKNPRHRYIIASLDQKLAVLLKRILPSKLFYKILASHYKVG
jgi:NAD(P)-dependent dehydrogenase (short-subunit alcohol dehydrogenase family)